MDKINHLQKLEWNTAIQNGITGISGKKYIFESELSVDRYVKLQEFLIHVSTGRSATDFINAVSKAYETLQEPRIMDAGKLLMGVLEGAKNNSELPHPAQKAVAMFFNAEDDSLDDRRAFDETKMMDKIKDWGNYGIGGFFELLINIQHGLKVS